MLIRLVFDLPDAPNSLQELGACEPREIARNVLELARIGARNIEAQAWDGETRDAWGETWTSL